MLSWVTGLQKAQKPPSWYQDEVRLSVVPSSSAAAAAVMSSEHNKPPRRGVGILPKLRRALESATINSTGSFPIKDTTAAEETVFEACDSNSSHCSQSIAADSCATGLSYNMSKIDDDNDNDTESIGISMTGSGIQQLVSDNFSIITGESPNNQSCSDADSIFGTPFREMVSFGAMPTPEENTDADDVWLLSSSDIVVQHHGKDDSDDITSAHDLKSPTGSIRSRVPVLVLPGKRTNTNAVNTAVNWCDDFSEEEIDFGDSSGLLNDGSDTSRDRFFRPDYYQDYSCDESGSAISFTKSNSKSNSSFMQKFHVMGRNRAQILGNNIKDMWSSNIDSRKNNTGKDWGPPKRGRRRTRSKKQVSLPRKHLPSPPPLSFNDPLGDLSRYHERMSHCTQPFSPMQSFSRICDANDRSEHDEKPECMDENIFSLCSLGSKGADQSLTSSPTTFPRVDNVHQECHTITDDDDSDDSNDSDLSEKQKTSSPSVVDPPHKTSPLVRKNTPPLLKTSTERDSKAPSKTGNKEFKFKFKSPRNDTPRIVWSDGNAEEESDEPRVLYTSEGEVAAIVHPKPESYLHVQRGISRTSSSSSRNVLRHVFHSELSTLYEESSSLESSSFGTSAGSASSSEAVTVSSSSMVPTTHDPSNHSVGNESSSATDSTGSTNRGHSENQPPQHHHQRSSNSHKKSHVAAGNFRGIQAIDNETTERGSFIDDREVKMRWEFSLGLIDNSGQWRQPMSLMNTEELSSDYVAEI